MRGESAKPPGPRLLLALLLGAAAGALVGPRTAVLQPLAEAQLLLLKVLAVPVVVASILKGVGGVSLRQLGGLGLRLAAAYALLALAATTAGAVVAGLLFDVAATPALASGDAGHAGARRPLLAGWADGLTLDHAIPIALVAALALALATAAWRERVGPAAALGRAFLRFHAVTDLALQVVLWLLPLGVFALVAIAVGSASLETARRLGLALVAVYAAQALVALFLLALAPSPRPLLAAAREALVTAFATGSSAASLPVEQRAAEAGLGRDPATAAFALSLGANVCKAGTAAFLGALSIAAFALSGREATAGELGAVALVATVAAIATPPVTGGGFVMLAFVASQVDLPLDLVAALLALPLVGKANTPLNALGRLVCVARLVPARAPASV
jgi:Na+/H+-dicarboxylate symporter